MTADSPTRHRWGRVLMLLALLVTAAGVLGVVNPAHLVWVERLLHHPYPMGIAAAVLFTVGVRLALDKVVTRLAIGAICLAAGIGWGGAWLLSPGDDGAVATSRAPERAAYEAVVRKVGDDDDPAWRVSVRQIGSLLAREWAVGCVRPEIPGRGFEEVRWAAADRLVVELGEGPVLRVSVDPGSGRPERGTGPGWTRC